jgi:hypothetical protein
MNDEILKTRFSDRVIIPQQTLNREAAIKLARLLSSYPEYKSIISDINKQLQTIYCYKIKCYGCGRKTVYDSYQQLTDDDIKKREEYFLCESCYDSEDFK